MSSAVPEVDDELVSAYLDDELSAREAEAVAGLLASDANWAVRLEDFKQDSRDLKRLGAGELSDSMRELVYSLAVSDLEAGRERRRVPRFRRRWMLLAALVLPAALTLVFFQNPNSTCRLYLKQDGLELQAGRSILEDEFAPKKTWKSPKLWGTFKPGTLSALSYQVDCEDVDGCEILSEVDYDFDGDGQIDRREKYKKSEPDANRGWERFTPELTEFDGDYQNFEGGEISVTLRVTNDAEKVTKVSGTPGELILPYKALKTSKGANE